MDPVIIVHGGAYPIPNHLEILFAAGIKEAAKTGYKVLLDGGSAVDAVECAVRSLEDCPVFNAGTGSIVTTAGQVEMDALIMRGDNLDAGAVTCVTNVKHPISLARIVMEKTKHVMLAGLPATQFARDNGFDMVTNEELASKYRGHPSVAKKEKACDTVGAVALDRHGNIAVASSTGGIENKLPGRVGDTPCIGAGGYCDDEVGGVATTGWGEFILRVCLSSRIASLMQSGVSVQAAVEQSLAYMKERVAGYGGAICISNKGDIGHFCTTKNMSWASIKGNTLRYGLHPSDDNVEDLDSN